MIKIESSVYNHYDKPIEAPCVLGFQDITYARFKSVPVFRNEFLNQYLLVYIVRGSLCLLLDDEKLTLSDKDLILIAPYCHIQNIESSNNLPDSDTAFYTVDFSCSSFTFFELGRYMAVKNCEAIESNLREMLADYKSEDDFAYYRDAELISLIRMVKHLAFRISDQRHLAEKVKTYITHNLMMPLTVNDISRELKYNKDHLCRIFKREYHTSLKDYIDNEKVELAKKILRTSDLPIVAISQLLGWYDLNLFLKYFKYHTNQTPSQYRENSHYVEGTDN